MKRWLIIGLVAVVSSVALIAAMTMSTAQFDKLTPMDGNILAMGTIDGTSWAPDPLISCTNMMPGETRTFDLIFQPGGTLNQDLYIGLKDFPGDPTCDFAHSGYVYTRWDVGYDGWDTGWHDIVDLFAYFQPLAAGVAPGSNVYVKVQIYVDKAMPAYDPIKDVTYMGAAADFYVLIDAVQAGGDAPIEHPDYVTLP